MNFWEYLNARAIRSSNVDVMIARTQRNLSSYTLTVIAGVLIALFWLPKPIDPIVKDILLLMLGGLASNWATQNGFWYGRPRAAGIPDPAQTTVEQTTVTKTTPTPPGEKPGG